MRFDLTVNTRARRAEEMLSVDTKGQLRPNLEAREPIHRPLGTASYRRSPSLSSDRCRLVSREVVEWLCSPVRDAIRIRSRLLTAAPPHLRPLCALVSNHQTIKEDYRNRLREAAAARVALRGDVEASEGALTDLCARAALPLARSRIHSIRACVRACVRVACFTLHGAAFPPAPGFSCCFAV